MFRFYGYGNPSMIPTPTISTPRLIEIMEDKYISANRGKEVPSFDWLTTEQKVEATRELVFDFEYPIWDETYRKTFETNFINFFYYKRIGSETWGMFRQRLLAQLTIKFPTWNEWYKRQEQLKGINLFDTYNLVNSTERDIINTGDTTSLTEDTSTLAAETNEKSRMGNTQDFQDTPNSALPPDMKFSTNITDSTQTTEAEANQNNTQERSQNSRTDVTNNTKEIVTSTQKGATGANYPQLLQSFFDVFLNIDLQIFAELNQLFLTVQDW